MSILEIESGKPHINSSSAVRSPTENAHHEINRSQIGNSGVGADLPISVASIAHDVKEAGAMLYGDGNRSFVILTVPQINGTERMGDWTKPQHRRDQDRFGVNHSQMMAIDATRMATKAGVSMSARNQTKRKDDADRHKDDMRRVTHNKTMNEIDRKVRDGMKELGQLPSK